MLSDAASTSCLNTCLNIKHLFNRCCHFAYGDAAMWPKCVRHAQNAIFTQNFAMSATPVICFLSVRKLVHYRCPCYHLFFYHSGDWFIIRCPCCFMFFSLFFSSFLSMRKLVHYHDPCLYFFFFFFNQSGNWFIIIVLVFACFFMNQETGLLLLSLFSFVFFIR